MSNDIQRFPSSLPFPFSRGVKAGGFLFLSGQVPMSAGGEVVRGDIQTQTRAACERIAESLEACGARLDQVVKATVWLDDARDFDEFNRIYSEFFPGNKPARSTIQARNMVATKIEIEVIACRP